MLAAVRRRGGGRGGIDTAWAYGGGGESYVALALTFFWQLWRQGGVRLLY